MKNRFYLLVILAAGTVLYAGYSIKSMLFNNRTPYFLECKGVLLDTNKVYAISNIDRKSGDTLFINFPQSKVIMPTTLGYLYFDRQLKEFVLKNNDCVFNAGKGKPDNYFLPFARTLNDELFEKGIYFGGGEIIREDILRERGIKYNSSTGEKENRVSVELLEFSGRIYLKTKDDGVGTRYLVQSNAKNEFAVILNQPVRSNSPNVFLFDNTALGSGAYNIEADAKTFYATVKLKNDNDRILKNLTGGRLIFTVDDFLFTVTPKYTKKFATYYILFLISLIGFQVYFLTRYVKTGSPVIQSLFSIRILLNCIVMLGVPLFLTAYYLSPGRSYFPVLIIVLNISFFISKRLLHNINPGKYKSVLTTVAWVIVLSAPLLLKLFTHNESLFGVIPVLHIQKIIILLLIYVTQNGFLKFDRHKYKIRIGFILLYSAVIAFITSDIGSILYAAIAMLLVELVRKTIKLRTAALIFGGIAFLVFIGYRIFPEKLSERKYYRLVAAYASPESKNLLVANQADRESYSTLLLNLKNIAEFKAPEFNDVVIPANMRSTSHSDFAFHWSLTFGGAVFFILFLVVIFFLVSNLVLLLYCSIRECRIGENKSFSFPLTREAELVRFLLAFTIISFVYPVASNMVLIPLTGQSIPSLSISNVEIIFLILLLISLSSIFSNEAYIKTNSKAKYYYGDAKVSMKYAMFRILALFFVALLFRIVSLHKADSFMSWKKHITDENIQLSEQIPAAQDKQALVDFGKKVIGNDELTSVGRKKKPILKNLASLYFSNRAYNETIYETKDFKNSSRKLLNQMVVDSIFNTRQKLISGEHHPFGAVFSFNQKVNGKQVMKVTNDFYSSIPFYAETIYADLTAECARELEIHLALIGIPGNIGSVMIIENHTGYVIANSSYPLLSEVNSNEIYYFIGSVKKILIAYAALAIDANYRNKIYGGKTFQEFLQYSDDLYAASLLRDLLRNHRRQLESVLTDDFDLPLYSLTDDAYLDTMPEERDFNKELNRNNVIYRQSIGQQKPYKFVDAMKWFTRLASGLKVELTYTNDRKTYGAQSLRKEDRDYLIVSLHRVLYGTAPRVRQALENNNINTDGIICKTGTAEAADKQSNASSSFILSNSEYTIGIMLKGSIPENNARLAAKDLFVSLIPVLEKYSILK